MAEKKARTRKSGQLETQIMRMLWARGEGVTVREVCDMFEDPHPAYTTVATVLTRLHHKGEVTRVGQARDGYRFSPAKSEGEHAGSRMLSALEGATDRRAALLNFAGNLDPVDVDLLREAFGE